MQISGVLVSAQTVAMASAPGDPAVPMMTSTLFFWIGLRALTAESVGSDASLSAISLIYLPPTWFLKARAAFMP